MAKEEAQDKLEELPIPFSDVRNIIQEIHLDDELTRSRCRAWLVLSSTKYLQADILCPGCIVDFRIMIRPISSEFLSFFKISLPGNTGWYEMFAGSNQCLLRLLRFSFPRSAEGKMRKRER